MGTNLLLRDGATPLVVIDDVVRDMGIPVNIEERIKEGRGGLGEDEYSVYGTVADNAGISVDDISHILNIKASKVNAILTILEIKGYITTFSGKAYPTNNS
ncbi:MAG: winged helix-turn-helix transcriptional regulator [Mogibacterium sp.]|nr:winged helix-turn-helix transcriptional regulator [Mogibacterium sp.]